MTPDDAFARAAAAACAPEVFHGGGAAASREATAAARSAVRDTGAALVAVPRWALTAIGAQGPIRGYRYGVGAAAVGAAAVGAAAAGSTTAAAVVRRLRATTFARGGYSPY